jgi:hypothetical protein
MDTPGTVNRRSLLVTTVAVVAIVLVTVVPARGGPGPGSPGVPRAMALTTLPAGAPTDAEVMAAARSTCAELPLPRISRSEIASCERWFADAAAQALLVGVDNDVRTQADLAVAMCGGPDCAAFVAGDDLSGLSKYQWPRVRLVASSSVTAALAYVTPHVT